MILITIYEGKQNLSKCVMEAGRGFCSEGTDYPDCLHLGLPPSPDHPHLVLPSLPAQGPLVQLQLLTACLLDEPLMKHVTGCIQLCFLDGL